MLLLLLLYIRMYVIGKTLSTEEADRLRRELEDVQNLRAHSEAMWKGAEKEVGISIIIIIIVVVIIIIIVVIIIIIIIMSARGLLVDTLYV